jgi:hypothetical protein
VVKQAVFAVKADVETTDDRQLAELELHGLLGVEPRRLESARPAELGPLVDAATALGAPVEDLYVADVRDGSEALLTERLALIGFYTSFANDGSVQITTTRQSELEAAGGASGKASDGRSRVKNEYLVHNWHKYKAKFFPRMARALTNATTPIGTVGDPFAGSGTLLVEASLMGVPSRGVDIDPLSVEISACKLAGLQLDTHVAEKAVLHFHQASAAFASDSLLGDLTPPPDGRGSDVLPEFIGRKLPVEQRTEVEAHLKLLRAVVASCPDAEGRRLLQLALSHAVATKVNLRWMGTGDNRFALALAVRPLPRIMALHLRKMLNGLAQRDGLVARAAIGRLGQSDVQVGDARALPWADESLQGIVTSPPYLPAASGRESYLRSRAASLTAVGLLTEAEVLEREAQMVGSILRSASSDSTGLPPSIRELVEWMVPQRARKPKALPTAAYFLDIAASLREMGRVVAPGGSVAMVLSAEHVFYDLVGRQIVRRLDMPDTIAQLLEDPANEVPLQLDKVVRIRLPKMDYAARPASTGDYSEAILIARRNG